MTWYGYDGRYTNDPMYDVEFFTLSKLRVACGGEAVIRGYNVHA